MKPFIKFFSSLELAIACLVLGFVLVFLGTIDQVTLGIHGATERYFYSFFVYWTIPNTNIAIPYLPGGYTIGTVFLINLVSALFTRFRYAWKKSGILIMHFGVITLLLGELITSMLQIDSSMVIDEGSSSNYSEDRRDSELAVVDHGHSSTTDRVYAFPESMLKDKRSLSHESLPFTISINHLMPNADIRRRDENAPSEALIANQGLGLEYYAVELPKTGKMDDINRTTIILTIFDDSSDVLGTWLLTWGFPPQKFEFQGKEYSLELRRQRYYYPFDIQLVDFSHDRYLGTSVPKNFSSDIVLSNKETGEQREFLIYMNHPLRYQGLTFFQSGFANEDRTTILQVVSNPGRHLPYISCILIFFGLTLQFTISLITFVKRNAKKS